MNSSLRFMLGHLPRCVQPNIASDCTYLQQDVLRSDTSHAIIICSRRQKRIANTCEAVQILVFLLQLLVNKPIHFCHQKCLSCTLLNKKHLPCLNEAYQIAFLKHAYLLCCINVPRIIFMKGLKTALSVSYYSMTYLIFSYCFSLELNVSEFQPTDRPNRLAEQ